MARRRTARPDRDPRRGVAAAAGHASRRGRAGRAGRGRRRPFPPGGGRAAGPGRSEPAPQARGPSLPRQFAAQLLHFFALLLWIAAGAGLRRPDVPARLGDHRRGDRQRRLQLRAGIPGRAGHRALAALLPEEATALRDGRKRRVPAAELVPGDILLLTEGDRVLVDGRVLQADDLKVDNAALTGVAGRCGASTGSRRGPGGGRARACRAGFRRAGAVARGRRPGR